MDGSTNILCSYLKYFTKHQISILYGLICVIPESYLIQVVEILPQNGREYFMKCAMNIHMKLH